jgi:hypothetical protein
MAMVKQCGWQNGFTFVTWMPKNYLPPEDKRSTQNDKSFTFYGVGLFIHSFSIQHQQRLSLLMGVQVASFISTPCSGTHTAVHFTDISHSYFEGE